MMRVLAADTATDYCSVAICESTSEQSLVLSEVNVLAGRRHSEILLTLSAQVLQCAQLTLGDIDLLAISEGPGSFTGLRVGVSTWKGLALGAGKPLCGVPTLEAMARRIPLEGATVAPLLDARMKEVFAAAFRVQDGTFKPILAPMVGTIEDLATQLPNDAVLFGDGVARYEEEIRSLLPHAQILDGEFTYPRAAEVGLTAARLASAGMDCDAASVRPVYLRKSQAERVRQTSEAVSAG